MQLATSTTTMKQTEAAGLRVRTRSPHLARKGEGAAAATASASSANDTLAIETALKLSLQCNRQLSRREGPSIAAAAGMQTGKCFIAKVKKPGRAHNPQEAP